MFFFLLLKPFSYAHSVRGHYRFMAHAECVNRWPRFRCLQLSDHKDSQFLQALMESVKGLVLLLLCLLVQRGGRKRKGEECRRV